MIAGETNISSLCEPKLPIDYILNGCWKEFITNFPSVAGLLEIAVSPIYFLLVNQESIPKWIMTVHWRKTFAEGAAERVVVAPNRPICLSASLLICSFASLLLCFSPSRTFGVVDIGGLDIRGWGLGFLDIRGFGHSGSGLVFGHSGFLDVRGWPPNVRQTPNVRKWNLNHNPEPRMSINESWLIQTPNPECPRVMMSPNPEPRTSKT